jgi:hypothetical protein
MEAIKTRFIIEVMGKPKEIVEETLKKVAESIEDRYEVINKELSELKLLDGSDIFSAFVEIEFKTNSFEDFFLAVIDFGPTVVEILEPSEISIPNSELQAVISDLISKLNLMSKAIQALKINNLKQKNKNETTNK